MPLTPEEQLKLNRLLKEQKKIEDDISNGVNIRKKRQDELASIRKEAINLQKKEVQLSDTAASLEKQLLATAKSKNKQSLLAGISNKSNVNLLTEAYKQEAKFSILSAQVVRNLDKQLDDNEELTSALQENDQLVASMGSGSYDLTALNEKLKEIAIERSEHEKELGVHGEKYYDRLEKSIKNRVKIQEAQAKEASYLEAADDLTGGMASKAKGAIDTFKTMGSKVGLVSVGLTAAVAILISFSGKMDAIGAQFGAIGLQSTEIRGDLLGAEQNAVRLGKSLEDVFESITTLTSEFGTGFAEARGMASSVIDTSVALGLSTSEGAQLIGTFATLSGLSNDAAVSLAKQTTLLATSSDVAPQQVLRDIAGSSAAIAKFTDASGENIARGAIQARKLGINLDTVAGSMESVLDFQSAIENATIATAITGKQINIQRLQELGLAGKVEEFAKEQRRLLGDQSDFLDMNFFQREALAKAVGLEVDQAAKMLDHQEEAITLAGQLAGQPGFDDLVGEKGISTLTQLTGSLKSLGATLTNSLGPALNLILKLLAFAGKIIGVILEPINAILRGMNVGIDNAFAVPSAQGGAKTGIGMAGGSEIATAHDGGITTEEGMYNLASQEALLPIEKLKGMLIDAVKPQEPIISTEKLGNIIPTGNNISVESITNMMSDAMAPVVAAIDKLNEDFTKKHVPVLAQSNIDGAKKSSREMGRQLQINTA